MDIKVAFGQVIAELRAERGLTQEKLSELSTIDRTFLSDIERGIHQPTLTTIFLLAEALKIPASELVQQAERRVR